MSLMLLPRYYPHLISFAVFTLLLLFGRVDSHTVAKRNASRTCVEGGCNNNLRVLDIILADYEIKEWPTYNDGKPTIVSVNVYVNSLSSISAASMDYTMDIFLRQNWMDPRIRTSEKGINTTLTINDKKLLQKIWKPDLYFHNVKAANFHEVTVPNILIRISPNGKILYSMRLTLKLSCHMSLVNYPLDTQRCMIIFGSYAHTADMILLNWLGEPVQPDRNLEIPEFNLVRVKPSSSCLAKYDTDAHTSDQLVYTWSNPGIVVDSNGKIADFNLVDSYNSDDENDCANDIGYFSCLNATFVLRRQNGFHLIQTYLPTFLIVTISWVSFWLDVNAIPARVTLGVTTLLTLTTLASGARATLPPVSYIKAIDVWIGVCSLFVFTALLEFTLVNYLSRKTYDPNRRVSIWRRPHKAEGEQHQMQPTGCDNLQRQRQENVQEMKDKVTNLRRARNVDKVCRILFPFIFFVFNLIYWPYYLTQAFDFD
ncbi:GLRA3 (predicted) [Pycnogonum litorale]